MFLSIIGGKNHHILGLPPIGHERYASFCQTWQMSIEKYLKWINFINEIKLSYYSLSKKNLIEHILLRVPETCGVASTRYQIQAPYTRTSSMQTSLATIGFLVHISETCLVLLINYCVSNEL